MNVIEVFDGVVSVATDHRLKRCDLKDDHTKVSDGIDVLSDIENIHNFKARSLRNLLLNHKSSCKGCTSKLNSYVTCKNDGKLGP